MGGGGVPAVRVARHANAPAISELLYEFNGEALSPKELARHMEQVEGLETVILGELDGLPVGLLVLRAVRTLSGPEHRVEVTELYLRPASRRMGSG